MFTKENARDCGIKGGKGRWKQYHAMKAELSTTKARLYAMPPQLPQTMAETTEFQTETLEHVRDEIRSTLERLKQEDEPRARESLSRSLGVLLEHEGHLSGRPKSGIRKPAPEKPRRQAQSFEPAPEIEPQAIPTKLVENPGPTTNGMLPGDGEGI
jgi:hypothetical protein